MYNKYVIKNGIYVHYYNMDIYRGKNNIISLLKSGDIYIKFNISSKKIYMMIMFHIIMEPNL